MSQRVRGFRHIVVPEFVFGDGARHITPTFLRNFGASHVMVVTDPGVAATGWTGEVIDDLDDAGIGYTVFSDVSSNPRCTQIASGAEMYHANHCDSLVAVGGGSVIDCAKGIGIVVSHDGNILDYTGVDTVAKPTPPLICVSTTTTSADVSQFAIVSDMSRHAKLGIISKMIVPDVSLLDPIVYTTLPGDLTSMCAIDSLSQAIEAYVSNAHSPFTDLLALDAVRLTWNSLPLVHEALHDIDLRSDLMYGNLEGGIAFSNASLGITHAVAHAVGGLTDAHHGTCISAVLRPCVEFNFEAARERYAEVGNSIGISLSDTPPDMRGEVFAGAISDFQERVGAQVTLSDLGVKRSDLPMLIEKTLADPSLLTNPRPVTARDLEMVYERSF